MIATLIHDVESETFLQAHENTQDRFYLNIGFNSDDEIETRFTTLDVEDAKFLIEKLTKFVKNK
tara:strand:- start:391 stop:582 length:192 start_codon:yes stop_codon:yes gene_type:complete